MQELACHGELCGALKVLLATPAVNIVDEADAYFDPRVQQIYAWGRKVPLPDREVRCEIVSELLHVLETDEAVLQLLASLDVAERTEHVGRWGGMPDVRLVLGVPHVLLQALLLHVQLCVSCMQIT